MKKAPSNRVGPHPTLPPPATFRGVFWCYPVLFWTILFSGIGLIAFLCLCLGCGLNQRGNVPSVNLYPNPVCDFNRQGRFTHTGDAAVDTASCNDPIAFSEILNHLPVIFRFFLLRPNEEKIENNKHKDEGNKC